ncbi:MAG: hypothetical protein R3190_04310 [Thermoanaerobaculia bacterium]|nr:hypothetical protein [Thermoanaerobaculia bacterium]
MKDRDVFWRLLLLASFVAAGVSLLTTALGLDRYIHVLLAWPLAFAVQAGLFGMAWLIAVGRRSLRLVVVALYLLTMPFSVVFSYVMLQSELTARIRPEEVRRALFDDLRERKAAVAREAAVSEEASDGLLLRLESWLALERDRGWTSATCEQNDHCYLDGVCSRVQRKIAAWESRTGLAYRHGPGEELIFGLLATERDEMRRVRDTLVAFRESWRQEEDLFGAGLDNRERLQRADAVFATVPAEEIRSVRCEAVALPGAPPYDPYSRDAAVDEERPVYAFEDLVAVLSGDRSWARSDYATLFAFGLALFIDLFVLFVALGAAILEIEGRDPYPVGDGTSSHWSLPVDPGSRIGG